MKEWQRFEIWVRQIHEQLAPSADVEHDVILTGRSGARRQVDVLIRQRVGLYSSLMVVECKRHRRPVGQQVIDSFLTVIDDLEAGIGVLISASGFTRGAREAATRGRVKLLTAQEATTADWRRVVRSDRLYFVVDSFNAKVSVETSQNNDFPLPMEAEIVSQERGALDTIGGIREQAWKAVKAAPLLGHFVVRYEVGDDLYISTDPERGDLTRLEISGVKTARRYEFCADVRQGTVLSGERESDPSFDQLDHADIPWREISETTQGRELSPDEYATRRAAPRKTLPFSPTVHEEDGVLSIRVERLSAELPD